MDLHEKSEAKESLTEHLYTIIHQNEIRKAQKLTELMEKLQMEEREEESSDLNLSNLPSMTLLNSIHPGTTSPTSPLHPGGGKSPLPQSSQPSGNATSSEESGTMQESVVSSQPVSTNKSEGNTDQSAESKGQTDGSGDSVSATESQPTIVSPSSTNVDKAVSNPKEEIANKTVTDLMKSEIEIKNSNNEDSDKTRDQNENVTLTEANS